MLNTDIMTSRGRRAVYDNKTSYTQYAISINQQYFLSINKFSIFEASLLFCLKRNMIILSMKSLTSLTETSLIWNYRQEQRLNSYGSSVTNVRWWCENWYSGCSSIIADIYLVRPHLQSSWLEIRPRQAVMEISEITHRCEPSQRKEQSWGPLSLSMSL